MTTTMQINRATDAERIAGAKARIQKAREDISITSFVIEMEEALGQASPEKAGLGKAFLGAFGQHLDRITAELDK